MTLPEGVDFRRRELTSSTVPSARLEAHRGTGRDLSLQP